MAYKLIPDQKKNESNLNISSISKTAGRSAAIGAGAAASAIPGTIGNIFSTANEFVARPLYKAISGNEGVPYEQTDIGKIFPTTETHIENLEKTFPFFKPKNEIEKFSRDVVRDATELFTPGKIFKAQKYAFSPLRSLGISLGSNVAGEGVSSFTGDESKGKNVKNGMMLVASLFNPMTAKQYAQNLYQKAEKFLPSSAMGNALPLTKKLNDLESRILRGRSKENVSSSEKFVLDSVEKFKKLVEGGQVNMHSLTAQKRSFNEDLQNNLFNIQNRAEKARARELAQGILSATKDTMKEYGKINPKWMEAQFGADEAFSVISKSNYISRTLEKFMKGRPEALAHLFGLGLPAGIAFVNPIGGAASVATYQAAKLAHRVSKSPVLRKHYSRVVNSALMGNQKAINSELDSMQEEISKEDKKKYRIIKNR